MVTPQLGSAGVIDVKPRGAIAASDCVDDPAAHAARLILARHAVELRERLGRSPTLSDVTAERCFCSEELPDLDGDGANDREVTSACDWGVHGAAHMIYFSNRGCRTFVGEILDGSLRALTTKRDGIVDLEAIWSNGCAGNDFAWTHYAWDGKAYAVVDKATCHLCTEGPAPAGANSHPYCKKELARRASAH